MPSSMKLSDLRNDIHDRELAPAGFIVTDYAQLLTVDGGTQGLLAGCLAFMPMENRTTVWQWDVQAGAWTIVSPFYATASNVGALAGMQVGDQVVLIDTNQIAFWNGSVWQYLS